PSAFCGITGFKPTAERIPSEGVMPLSHSLDSSGPLALSVECCALVDAVLSNEPEPTLETMDPSHIRLLMPTIYVSDNADEVVPTQFKAAVAKLKAQGVQIDEVEIPELAQLPYINRLGGFGCAEASFHPKASIEKNEELYDPRVASRILR